MYKTKPLNVALSVIVFVTLGLSSAGAQTEWYVDDSSTSGLNSGSDWANAFTELQSALAVAVDGDEIRVGQGTYTPDYDTHSNGHTGDREASFQLISGVKLYGGYAGFGAVNPGVRDAAQFVTYLGGDLFGDDGSEFANNADNSYHVVVADGVDINTILDGFTVIGGNGSGAGFPNNAGGGMFITQGSCQVANCVFEGNNASYGGGVCNFGNGNPAFTGCVFKANTADNGGGLVNSSSDATIANCEFLKNSTSTVNGIGGGMLNADSAAAVSNCVFEGNKASFGGGIYNHDDGAPVVTDSVFLRNRATRGGGAVYNAMGSAPTLVNCTITGNVVHGNTFEDSSGGIQSDPNSALVLNNSILWSNYRTYDDDESAQISGPVASVNYCCIQNCENCVNPGGSNDNFGVGNFSDDPLLIQDGRYLRSGSPCIDGGDPGLDYTGRLDINGEPRVVGGGVDIGADELIDLDSDGLPDWWESYHFGFATAASPEADHDNDQRDNIDEYASSTNPLVRPRTYYVSESGNDEWSGLQSYSYNGDGPKATIQAAIDAAHPYEGDEVLILMGTYSGPGNRDLNFNGKRITVTGDINCYPYYAELTVIDCGGSEQEHHRGFVFNSMEDSKSVLRGLTIRGGYANEGGAIYCDLGSPALEKCVITGNIADDRGGGIYFAFGRSTIDQCTFTGNRAFSYGEDCGGGAIYCDGSKLILNNCVFEQNKADIYGGAVFNNEGDILLEASSLRRNISNVDGGGIYNFHASATLRNCDFIENDAFDMGGGMLNRDSYVEMSNCNYIGNDAGKGGGLYNERSDLRISICIFSFNSALSWYSGPGGPGCGCTSGSGGGIYNNSSNPAVEHCSFSNNTAGGSGGGMLNLNSNPTLTNCTFTSNSVEEELEYSWSTVMCPGHGGGITNSHSNPLIIDNQFISNISMHGGAVYNTNSDPVFVRCQFKANEAYGSGVLNCDPGWGGGCSAYPGAGAGIYNNSSSPTLEKCEFIENIADGLTEAYGGGLYNEESNPTLNGCMFTGNRAKISGGAVYNDTSSPVSGNTLISGNSSIYGAGVYSKSSSPSYTNCVFRSNLAHGAVDWCGTFGHGGGMYNDDSDSELVNCVFNGNAATGSNTGTGGGIFNNASSPRLINCTFSGNSAVEMFGGKGPDKDCSDMGSGWVGGGMYNTNGSGAEIANCIFWDNVDRTGSVEQAQIADEFSTTAVTFSCVQGVVGDVGNNNIGLDPLFVDADGPDDVPGTEDDNLRLQVKSPCINSGDSGSVAVGVDTDIDNTPRVHGCVVDMGAYENQQAGYFGDSNEDCSIGITDYTDFYMCLERFGLEQKSMLEWCVSVYDADKDDDVDLADFAVFQRVFAGQ